MVGVSIEGFPKSERAGVLSRPSDVLFRQDMNADILMFLKTERNCRMRQALFINYDVYQIRFTFS